MIQIKEVITKGQLSKFVNFPDTLYKGNKYMVPQLHVFERSTLSRAKNPAFEFCEAKYWLAYKNRQLVGRIAAIINHKVNELKNEKTVRFGWIDFIDDLEVSALLIKQAEDWGKSKGMSQVQGPLGFSDLDMEGMLVKGFEEIGTQAVIYNYPYYPVHLEKNGYIKDVDWIQFEIKVPTQVPEKVKHMSELVLKKYDLRILKFKKAKDVLPYANKMFYTLNEAYINLYGFAPLTEKQIKYYIKKYFAIVNPKYICFIADRNDNVIGFGIGFLSLSKALINAKGRLFPFGFLQILKDMHKNDTADLLLQAVNDEYKLKGVPAVFFAHIMQAFIDNGIQTAISSPALETNNRAFLMFTNGYEVRQYTRRRCYTKYL